MARGSEEKRNLATRVRGAERPVIRVTDYSLLEMLVDGMHVFS